MKKNICFRFMGVDFTVSPVLIFFLFVSYVVGGIMSVFLNVEISDKIFSPLIMVSSGKAAAIFFSSLLYYFLFIVLGFIFATSYFGFLLFPLMTAIKGLFSALTVKSFLLVNNYYSALLYAGVLLTVEVGIILIYFSQSMFVSFKFFKNKGEKPEFSDCLKQFTVSAVLMVLLAAVNGLVQYLIL